MSWGIAYDDLQPVQCDQPGQHMVTSLVICVDIRNPAGSFSPVCYLDMSREQLRCYISECFMDSLAVACEDTTGCAVMNGVVNKPHNKC